MKAHVYVPFIGYKRQKPQIVSAVLCLRFRRVFKLSGCGLGADTVARR